MGRVFWRPKLTTGDLRRIVGPAATVLEIGANDGEDTLELLRAFPESHIFAFEPDPRPIARFRALVTEVTLIPMAASDHNGREPWFASHGCIPQRSLNWHPWAEEVKTDWDLSGSVCRPTGHLKSSPWVEFQEEGTIPCTTLDTWLETTEIDSIDFVWMDVQGAEHKVLQGGKEAFKHTRWLYTEFFDRYLMQRDIDEQYEGQPSLGGIMALLPGWTVRAFYQGENVLLENLEQIT